MVSTRCVLSAGHAGVSCSDPTGGEGRDQQREGIRRPPSLPPDPQHADAPPEGRKRPRRVGIDPASTRSLHDREGERYLASPWPADRHPAARPSTPPGRAAHAETARRARLTLCTARRGPSTQKTTYHGWLLGKGAKGWFSSAEPLERPRIRAKLREPPSPQAAIKPWGELLKRRAGGLAAAGRVGSGVVRKQRVGLELKYIQEVDYEDPSDPQTRPDSTVKGIGLNADRVNHPASCNSVLDGSLHMERLERRLL